LPENNALLWRLTHKDAPGISFLFGTMHVSDERAFGQTESLLRAISLTDAFAAEFDSSEAQSVSTSDSLRLPHGITLESLLGKSHYPRIRAHLHRYTGLDIAAYNDFIPFMVIQAIHMGFLSSDRKMHLDEFLETEARIMGKRILGVESLEEQIQVLSKLPLDWQRKELVSLSRRIPAFRKQLNRLTEMYARGDVRQIYQSGRQRLGKLREIMLFQRNRIMASRIHHMAMEQTLFAAVGAAHLSGKEGLLALLKAKGWKCRPA
jgi:uncharacterized protein YbaP (TraB family)